MCIDYGQTIKKLTLLDRYPLPHMQDVVRNVSQYNVFSTLDLRRAWHFQMRLKFSPHLKPKTNCFNLRDCRLVKKILRRVSNVQSTALLKKTIAKVRMYRDNITVGGKTQEEYDENLRHFLKVAKESNLTLNESKCTYSSDSIDLIGYGILKGTLQPDQGRGKTLLNMPVLENLKSLQK